ncbi:MAG: hypothetical protein ACYC3S_04790 [Chloroflexota bacterium]
MDVNERQNGLSWPILLGSAGLFALLGWLASLLYSQPKASKGLGSSLGAIDFGRARGVGDDLRRAGQATARGVGAGLSGVWDVALGGADAVRARANVLPVVAGAVDETRASLGRALGQTFGGIRSFLGTTARTLMWLSLIGSAALFIYMPDPAQRDRFYAQLRDYWYGVRSLFDKSE